MNTKEHKRNLEKRNYSFERTVNKKKRFLK